MKNAVETDLTTRQLLSFAKLLKDVEENGPSMQMVEGAPAYLGDVSYWIPDIMETRKNFFAGVGKTMTARMEEDAVHDATVYRAQMPERLRVMTETEERELLPSAEELLAEGETAIEAQRSARGEKKSADKASEKKEKGTEKEEHAQKPVQESAEDRAEDISVMIINASGIDGAGAEIADTLRAKGFRISSVETGSVSDRPKTAVMTTDAHVNMFYGMPFPCVIMPVDGAGEKQAIVIIGRDYQPDAADKDGEE